MSWDSFYSFDDGDRGSSKGHISIHKLALDPMMVEGLEFLFYTQSTAQTHVLTPLGRKVTLN